MIVYRLIVRLNLNKYKQIIINYSLDDATFAVVVDDGGNAAEGGGRGGGGCLQGMARRRLTSIVFFFYLFVYIHACFVFIYIQK